MVVTAVNVREVVAGCCDVEAVESAACSLVCGCIGASIGVSLITKEIERVLAIICTPRGSESDIGAALAAVRIKRIMAVSVSAAGAFSTGTVVDGARTRINWPQTI